MKNKLNRWMNVIHSSYAHNSMFYRILAEKADIKAIVQFLEWDSFQPPFYKYLNNWVSKVPDYIKVPLIDHIEVEVREKHYELFTEMLNYLRTGLDKSTKVDYNQQVL